MIKIALKNVSKFYVRTRKDDVLGKAAALSYITVLTFIPLLTLIVSFYSRFSAYSHLEERVKNLLLRFFLPQFAMRVKFVIDKLIASSTSIGIISILGIILFSLLLVESLENSVNGLRGIYTKRPFLLKMLTYWAFLTLSPVLIVLSIFTTTKFSSYSIFRYALLNPLFNISVNFLFPLFITSLAFFILYYLLISVKVSIKNAVICSLSAGILWELSKYLFDIYFKHFSVSYRVYGALSTIPALLIWVYYSYVIALWGAELLYTLEGYEIGKFRAEALFSVLVLFYKYYLSEGPISIKNLVEETGFSMSSVHTAVIELEKLGYITKIGRELYAVRHHPSKLTVASVLNKIGIVNTKEFDNPLWARIRPKLIGFLHDTESITMEEATNWIGN